MNKFILIDSGFWMALYDPRDGHHKKALKIVEDFDGNNIVIPWPTLYETLNTRFCKNKAATLGFNSFIKAPNTKLVDDLEHREENLAQTFFEKRSLSLVDRAIRSILSNNSYRIDYLVTFNIGDFIDICSYRKIEVITQDTQ